MKQNGSGTDGINRYLLNQPRNSTKFTCLLILIPVDGEEPRHVCHLLLRVGVQIKPPLYLVSLALPSVLAGAGGKARAAGVTPGVAAALVITGAAVRASPDDVVIALLAQVQHAASRQGGRAW